MKTNKYFLADLIQFIIQKLVDEDNHRKDQVIRLLLQAKNTLLTPESDVQTEGNSEAIISEFIDPEKNPLMRELTDKLNKYETTITDTENFSKVFQRALDDVEKEDILHGLQKQSTL